jgi:hypothetical protein
LQHLPEFAGRIDEMHAIVVQKAAATPAMTFACGSPPETNSASVALFRVDAGAIAGPLQFPISSAEHTKSQSMEARIAEALASFPPARLKTSTERMEHLAMLKRWCFRGSRVGEIFFADGRGELPMRRLVRGISRVVKGEPQEGEIIPSASE